MVGVVERKNEAAEGVAERARSGIGSGSGSESWKVGVWARTFERTVALFSAVWLLRRRPESSELKRPHSWVEFNGSRA